MNRSAKNRQVPIDPHLPIDPPSIHSYILASTMPRRPTKIAGQDTTRDVSKEASRVKKGSKVAQNHLAHKGATPFTPTPRHVLVVSINSQLPTPYIMR